MPLFRLAALGLGLFLVLASESAASAPVRPLEVALWPTDSRVLQEGIRELADEKWALTHPSLLLYAPRAPSTRAAVLVFAGGGYKQLALGPESTLGPDGADVCRWLTEAGITCVVVRYRVPNTGCNWNPVTRRHDTPAIPMALQDAQRAMSLVRHRAQEFGLDPGKIGVMGFSAGGNLAVLSSTAFRTRAYAAVDAIDRVSNRPDFAIPVYPGHMTMEHKNKIPKSVAAQQLNTDIAVSADVPPTLLIHAKDDPVDPVHYSTVYARELKKAGAPVEMILYETGGHAFGVRKQGKDTDRWTGDAMRWLRGIGIRPVRAPELCAGIAREKAPDMQILESDLGHAEAVAAAEKTREMVARGTVDGEYSFGAKNQLKILEGHVLREHALADRRESGAASVEGRESTALFCRWLVKEGSWYD